MIELTLLPVFVQATAGALAPAAPPAPPLPNSGEIHCTLQTSGESVAKLDGVLALSEPRAEGKRYSQVKFVSDDVPELTNTFSAKWSSSGGDLLAASRDGSTISTIRLLTKTYAPGQGAIAVEVWSTNAGTRRYYSGLCEQTLTYTNSKGQP